MKNSYVFLVCFLFLLGSWVGALDLQDIVRLSKAKVGDEIIINIIQASDDKISLSANDIIHLKESNVSDKIIITLIKSGQKKTPAKTPEFAERISPANAEEELQKVPNEKQPSQKKKELSPFDQFFLSTYYSHDYGWPEKNYESPSDILSQGLYYQAPRYYPDSRKVRVYGFGHSFVPGNPNAYTSSPYSILVPRHPKGGSYYGYYKKGGRYHHNGGYYPRHCK